MAMVKSGNIRALEKIASGIIQSALSMKPKTGTRYSRALLMLYINHYHSHAHTGTWSDYMPSWKSKGHPRGLLAMGQSRDKKTRQIITKRGALPNVQRKAATESCTEYMTFLGYPPVVAGESLKKVTRNVYNVTHNI